MYYLIYVTNTYINLVFQDSEGNREFLATIHNKELARKIVKYLNSIE